MRRVKVAWVPCNRSVTPGVSRRDIQPLLTLVAAQRRHDRVDADGALSKIEGRGGTLYEHFYQRDVFRQVEWTAPPRNSLQRARWLCEAGFQELLVQHDAWVEMKE